MAFKSIKVDEAVAAEFKKLALDNQISMTAMLNRLLANKVNNEALDTIAIKISAIDSRLDMMGTYINKRFTAIDKSLSKVSRNMPAEVAPQADTKVPEEMKGLKPDELPKCCQSIFADGEPSCEHWVVMWVNEFGQKKLGWKNTLTGRTANDEAYHKYV